MSTATMTRLTIDEAARRGNVSKTTLWRLARDGRLPLYGRAGTRRRYVEVSDLERALDFVPVRGRPRGS